MRKRSRVVLISTLAATALFSATLSWAQSAQGDQGRAEVASPKAGAWASVAVGTWHSCGIQQTGTLWCWGPNKSGELGTGRDKSWQFQPVQVGTRTDWVFVMAGHNSGCAIPTGGTLWCWGRGDHGQLGDGQTAIARTPERIGTATDWASVSGSNGGTGYETDSHTCGLHTDGTAWCWGENAAGQVGDGTQDDRRTPTQVGSTSDWTSISAGNARSCGTQADGSLWCWGSGDLGNGTTETALEPERIGSDSDWVAESAGSGYTCASKTDGTLWCWGLNARGQLGDGTTVERLTPVQVGGSRGWRSVTAGSATTCGTRANGSAWCWGENFKGELGNGNRHSQALPTRVLGGARHWASQVVVRNVHTCGLGADQTLWCWGYNKYGQVGSGTHERQVLLPEQVEAP